MCVCVCLCEGIYYQPSPLVDFFGYKHQSFYDSENAKCHTGVLMSLLCRRYSVAGGHADISKTPEEEVQPVQDDVSLQLYCHVP